MNGQFPIYKRSAAAQFSLIPYNADSKKSGALFCEMAKAKEGVERQYTWENKLKFAFGPADYAIIFDVIERGTGGAITLTHVQDGKDPKTESKIMKITPGEGKYEGTWNFNLRDNQLNSSIQVSLSTGEFFIFYQILKESVCSILGLDTSGQRASMNKLTNLQTTLEGALQ
jgi:hypothetical protein